jgi:hypothetical protein
MPPGGKEYGEVPELVRSRRISPPLSRGAVRALFLIYMTVSIVPALDAHELGTIQVSASFQQGGTWRVDVAIDEEHIPKLPATRPAGATRYGRIAGLTPEIAARLGIFLAALTDRSTLAFDGRPAAPEKVAVDRPPPPADDPFAPPPKVTLHLSGDIPPGARAAAFSTTIPVGTFPLAYSNEGDAAPYRRWQKEGEAGTAFPLSPRVVPPPRFQVALRYLGLGFRHVLPRGSELILFVLGIFLLSLRVRPLLAQVAAFALASTLGLALAAWSGFALAPRIVGPALALAIVYLGVGNLLSREVRPLRIGLVFAFGLLHGLAFAAALRELGPPRAVLATALLGFDLGALAGALAVLAAAFLFVGAPYRDRPWYRDRVVIPASLALATLGLYWSVERIFLP